MPEYNLWVADRGDGTYINPIIHADYSDPDAIRVGEDFFLVASSFNHLPGLPVLHSKDLVNWRLVNHVVKRLPYPAYDLPAHGQGIWAPSIRWHDGLFRVCFPTPDEGIFMSTTADPFGDWSEPLLIKEASGWIDPCPFWDEDGQAYLVNAFARSRTGFNSVLQVCRMKPDGTGLLDEGRIVFDGNAHHPTMEGPKFYKRNGFYYIFAPAGGVKQGWQTVLRSRNIFGPYEDRIVMRQGCSDVNGPHQGALIELASGESWFLHFQDKGAYGRIVHLQPVRWADDWPVIGEDADGDGIGEPTAHQRKPDVGGAHPIAVPATSDEFEGDQIGLQWQWPANPREAWYSLRDRPGSIRLFAAEEAEEGPLWRAPNLLLQKLPAPAFTATTMMDFNPGANGVRAGLTVFGLEYRSLELAAAEEGLKLRLVGGKVDAGEQILAELNAERGRIFLRLTVKEGARCSLEYSLDGAAYSCMGEDFAAQPGRWVGAKIGLFCLGKAGGYADFDWFRVGEVGCGHVISASLREIGFSFSSLFLMNRPSAPRASIRGGLDMDSTEIKEGRLYTDLAHLMRVISPPEDYAEEAVCWRQFLREKLGRGRHEILELGVGGGHNLSHLAADFEATAVDLSPSMLEQCRLLNPGVKLHQGDMREVRLGRKFAAVLIHDAISYMLTEADLAAAFRTAAAHLDSGGVLIVSPDRFSETFNGPETEQATHADGDTLVTYMEYTHDPDQKDTAVESIMFYLIESEGRLRIELDRHVTGLFPRSTWLRLMDEAGFDAETRRFRLAGAGQAYEFLAGVLR